MATTSKSLAQRTHSLGVLPESNANSAKPHTWTTSESKNLYNSKPSISQRKQINGKLALIIPKENDVQEHQRKNEEKTEKNIQFGDGGITFTEKYFSWRYMMVLLLNFSFVVALFLRNCLPMAMVCMVRPTQKHLNSSGKSEMNFTVIQNHSRMGTADADEDTYEFDWNSETQGLILTSIMFTTFLGPVLVDFVRKKFGNKNTLTGCTMMSVALTAASPIAARTDPYILVAIRMVLGLTLGGNVPILADTIAWWAPHSEKLTMTALSFAGINVGGILTSFFSGFLCAIPLDNGWPFVFYTFALASFLWGLAWHFLSSQKPEEHPYVSEKERQYIVSQRVGMETAANGKSEKLPYKQIFTSVPVFVFLAAGSCHFWASYLIFTYFPIYFNKVLGFGVKETGVLVSLTSLSRMMGSFFWTALGNKLRSVYNTNVSRKVCVLIGFTLAAGGLACVVIFGQQARWVAFGILTVTLVCQAVGSSVLPSLPLDMAPRYSGFLTGLFMSTSGFISISGPLITAALTPDNSVEQWQTVWIIMACVCFLPVLIFPPFGQVTLQPWAQGQSDNKPNIISPFVTMGRRFSTILETGPFTPLTPATEQENRFDFTITIQAPDNSEFMNAGNGLPGADTAFTHNATAGTNRSADIGKEIKKPTTGAENEAFEEEDEGIMIPDIKRAYSEFGFEVLKPTDHENWEQKMLKDLVSTADSKSSGQEDTERTNSPEEFTTSTPVSDGPSFYVKSDVALAVDSEWTRL